MPEPKKGLDSLSALLLTQSPKKEVIETSILSLSLPQMNKSPLLQLKVSAFEKDDKERELANPIFRRAIQSEQECTKLYEYLCYQLEQLADITIKARFAWRLRVGGVPGFRNLLMPAMHPVYGVPYIPASSVKGLVRAWAEQQNDGIKSQVNEMFGYLDKDSSSIAKVQFLDSFPTKPCLSLDIVNPQWHYPKEKSEIQVVSYKADPHALLSLENATLMVGLKATSRGDRADVERVKKWVTEALKTGLGSRSSAGYGYAQGQIKSTDTASCYPFSFWSQGIYGADTEVQEFRTVAIRGVLRYWFRAVALGLFDPVTTKILESRLFGSIDPAVCGSLKISIVDTKKLSSEIDGIMAIKGTIRLKANTEDDLILAESLLKLAFSLSGVGRGSRRPLHQNNRRLRGCHWEFAGLEIGMVAADWRGIIENARFAILAIQQIDTNLRPSDPLYYQQPNRTQDILNRRVHIYLLKCPKIKHPRAMNDAAWREFGSAYKVIGNGLNLLYSSPDYKGKSMEKIDGIVVDKPGNEHVGGAVTKTLRSIPSYVLIKSIFPSEGEPYQVITIFDVDGHNDRGTFSGAVKKKGGIMVWPPES